MLTVIYGTAKSGKTSELIRVLPRTKKILLVSLDKSTFDKPELFSITFRHSIIRFTLYDLSKIDLVVKEHDIKCIAIDELMHFCMPIVDISNALLCRYTNLDVYATCLVDSNGVPIHYRLEG